ncbi:MAG: hypothetical protein F6K39_02555 [Okeania sp. SIO3B3]|nr:hypothetical protein [Okeania sp. SIO3B3]
MSISRLKEIFEEKFWICGEVFDEAALSEPISLLYELPIYYLNSALEAARTTTGEPFTFLVGYVRNGTFNAAACDTEYGGLVCLHASVPYLLFMACVNYATRCDLETALPKVQDGMLIIYDDKITLPGRLADIDITPAKLTRNFEEFCHSLQTAERKDDVFQYGLFLYEIGIRFIVMHECMHIILGHTAYLRKKLGMNLLIEISSQREENLHKKLNQALEFLADRNTVCGILVQALDGNLLHSYGNNIPEFIKVDFSTFIARSVVQAICILMHQFPYKLENNLDSSLLKTHPHPYVRMQWMNTEMGNHVVGEEQFAEKIVLPFGYAMATLANNFVTPNSWADVNKENIDYSEKEMFSDFSYEYISGCAQKLQNEMWNLAPVYEGFIRGWRYN